MPIEVDGVEYFSVTDIHRELGIARQTLWRWRKARKIPQGRRYRDRQVVFTKQEVEAISEYSNRLEPADATKTNKILKPKFDETHRVMKDATRQKKSTK